jgi:dihydroxyacetone kinase
VAAGADAASVLSTAANTWALAADATARLAPKLGRAESHTSRSLGHPDAGAVSLALIACAIAEAIKE